MYILRVACMYGFDVIQEKHVFPVYNVQIEKKIKNADKKTHKYTPPPHMKG